MKNGHPVVLEHEEHDPHTIEPGTWEITPTHEYDHFEDSERIVAD